MLPVERSQDMQIKRNWKRKLWWLATLILILVLTSHPELRLMIPLLDTLGLDLLMLLLGAQVAAIFSDILLPSLLKVWRNHVAPALCAANAHSRQSPWLALARVQISHLLRRGRWRRALWLHLHVLWWRWIAPTNSTHTGTPSAVGPIVQLDAMLQAMLVPHSEA